MGNSASQSALRGKPQISIAQLEDCDKSISNFQNRWDNFIKSLDVTEDKIKLIEQLDESKKRKLILEYESKLPKDSVSYYIKILLVFSKSNLPILKKKEETQNLINAISSLEISLRTNSVDWIYEFINEDGLEILIDVMSNVLFLLSNTIEVANNRNNIQKRFQCGPFTPARDRKNSSLSKKSSMTDLPNSAKFLQPGQDVDKNNSDTNPRCNYKNLTVLSPSTIMKLKEILHLSLKCLKSLLNNQTGCRRAFNYPQVCEIITFCLLHPNHSTKQLSLEMLSALCLIEGGHSRVLEAFDCLHREIGEMSRFEYLINDFKRHEEFSTPEEYNIDYAASCMQFINIVVHSCDNINLRVYLQYCFHLMGLDKFITNIKDRCGQRLLEQIDAYQHNKVDCNLLLDDAEAKEDFQRELDSLRKSCQADDSKKLDDYERLVSLLKEKIENLELKLSKSEDENDLLQITLNNQIESSNSSEKTFFPSSKFDLPERLIPEGCDGSNSTSIQSTPDNMSKNKIPKPQRNGLANARDKKSIDSFDLDELKTFDRLQCFKCIEEAESLMGELNKLSIATSKYCLSPLKPLGWKIDNFKTTQENTIFSTLIFDENMKKLSLSNTSTLIDITNIKDPWKQSIINQEKSHSRVLSEPIDEIFNKLHLLSLDPISNEYLHSISEIRSSLQNSPNQIGLSKVVKIIEGIEEKFASSYQNDSTQLSSMLSHIYAIKALREFNLESRKISEQLAIILSACKSIISSRKLPIVLRLVNAIVMKITGSIDSTLLLEDQHFPINTIDQLINWRLSEVEFVTQKDNSISKSLTFIQMFYYFLKNSHPTIVDWTNEMTNIEKASACNLSGLNEAIERLENYYNAFRKIRNDPRESCEIGENLERIKNSYNSVKRVGQYTLLWLNDTQVDIINLPTRLSPIAKFVSAYRQQIFASTGTSNRLVTKYSTDSKEKKVTKKPSSYGDDGNIYRKSSDSNQNKVLCQTKRRSQTRQLNADGLLENILEGINSKPLRASLHTTEY